MVKIMGLGFIICIIWFLVGFVSVLWGLRGESSTLFGNNEDVFMGIVLGFITLGIVIIEKSSGCKIRDVLYNLVNKKVDKDDN